MDGGDRFLKPEEYETWVTPRAAIDRFAGVVHGNDTKVTIIRALKSGVLGSAAKFTRWAKDTGGFDERHFERLAPQIMGSE